MKKYQNLHAKAFAEKWLADENGILLDVRSSREYQEQHIAGAINIPFSEKEELVKLDKSKSYYVHCRVGGRSAVAAHQMALAGFKNVFNLNDDIADVYLQLQQVNPS